MMTSKDAKDLAFSNRDQALEIIIRLINERDTCVKTLQNFIEFGYDRKEAIATVSKIKE